MVIVHNRKTKTGYRSNRPSGSGRTESPIACFCLCMRYSISSGNSKAPRFRHAGPPEKREVIQTAAASVQYVHIATQFPFPLFQYTTTGSYRQDCLFRCSKNPDIYTLFAIKISSDNLSLSEVKKKSLQKAVKIGSRMQGYTRGKNRACGHYSPAFSAASRDTRLIHIIRTALAQKDKKD